MGKEPLFAARETDVAGTYQVWHKHGDGFRMAATVDTNLLGAIVRPNAGPDHPLGQNVHYTEAWERTTTFGDKLIDPTGKALEIYEDKQFQMLAVRETTHPQQDNQPETSAQKYEQYLKEATDRAVARMQGRDRGHER